MAVETEWIGDANILKGTLDIREKSYVYG